MQYLLRSVDSKKLDFHAEVLSRKLPLILLIVGLAFISVSVIGLMNSNWIFESSGIEVLLLGTGGIVSSAAWLMGKSVSSQPMRIRFDNEKACMVIGQDADFKKVAEIPYTEIREICSRIASRSGTNNVTQPVYEVLLVTVNLQVWRLGQFSSEEKARAHEEYLNQMIELKKSAQRNELVVPESVRQEIGGGKAILRWRNDQRSNRFFSIVFFASLFTILLFIFSNITVATWISIIIYVAIAVLELYLVYLMLTNWNEVFRVEIGDGELCCFRERGLKVKSLDKIKLDQIKSIGACFEFNQSDANIMIVEPELFGILGDMITGKIRFTDSIRTFRKAASSLKLPVANLSVVDRIRFSEMLRLLVRKAGGEQVI